MPTNNVIMAWDPGGTTGYTIGLWKPLTFEPYEVLWNGVVTWHNRLSRIRELIEEHQPTVTIVESFHLYKDKAEDQIGSDFPSCQVIGIIEAYLYMTGLNLPIYQPAALLHKPPVQIPLEYQPLIGSSEHEKDSFRHMRYWIERQRHQAPVRKRR